MNLSKQKKQKIVKKFGSDQEDSGSAPVQIAILTKEIEKITKHLKKNPKDNHTRKGLLGKVNKRRKLLRYLENQDEERYEKLTEKLGLK